MKNKKCKRMIRMVAAYISSKIDEVYLKIKDKSNHGKIFGSVMKSTWTHRDKRHFFIPKEYTCFSGIKVKFTTENQSSFNGKIITISINSIVKAKTKEDLKIAFIIVKSIVYHEVEHLIHVGSRVHNGNDKLGSFARYLSNKGEIRAHASMFSVLYCEIFPMYKLDIDKLISIGRDTGVSSIVYYFEVFGISKFIKKYPFVKGIRNDILRLTTEFIKEYQKYKGVL